MRKFLWPSQKSWTLKDSLKTSIDAKWRNRTQKITEKAKIKSKVNVHLLLSTLFTLGQTVQGKPSILPISEGLVNLKSIFSWNSIAQKMNEILDKILPYEGRAEFCQIFKSFLEFQEKLLLRFTDLYILFRNTGRQN